MIIDQLSQLKNLTLQEKAVADFIVKEPWKVLETSIHDLSVVTYTSASTIMRLCKKLGFKGFSDFKYHFASEYPVMVYTQENDNDSLIRDNTDQEELLQRLPLLYLKTIEQTRSFIESGQINRCAHAIHAAQYIPIYGTGLGFSLASTFQFKFQEIGIPATANNASNWRQLALLKERNIPTFAILISLSGENSSINEIAKELHSLDLPFLLISANPDAKCRKLATEYLRIYWSQRDELSSARYAIAVQFLMDTLLASIIIKRYPDIQKTEKRVRELYSSKMVKK